MPVSGAVRDQRNQQPVDDDMGKNGFPEDQCEKGEGNEEHNRQRSDHDAYEDEESYERLHNCDQEDKRHRL